MRSARVLASTTMGPLYRSSIMAQWFRNLLDSSILRAELEVPAKRPAGSWRGCSKPRPAGVATMRGTPSLEDGDMADYERMVEVAAPADRAFACLADPANMPKYVAMMTAADSRGGETVHVAAEVQGRHEGGDA